MDAKNSEGANEADETWEVRSSRDFQHVVADTGMLLHLGNDFDLHLFASARGVQRMAYGTSGSFDVPVEAYLEETVRVRMTRGSAIGLVNSMMYALLAAGVIKADTIRETLLSMEATLAEETESVQ